MTLLATAHNLRGTVISVKIQTPSLKDLKTKAFFSQEKYHRVWAVPLRSVPPWLPYRP